MTEVYCVLFLSGKLFSDPQFGIFPAEPHLGYDETQTSAELVPEEIRS